MRGPCLALSGRQAHAVQRCGDLLVRPSTRHAADHGHGFIGSAATMFAGFWFADTELRVLPTAPVDREDELARTFIVADDDVRNESPHKLLARSHGHAWGVPSGFEVCGEPRKIGGDGGRARSLERRQSGLALLDTLQRLLPA